MLTASRPKALFGGPLLGSKPLRFIYVDEAGTNPSEPVTVVAGIIVDADTQFSLAEEELASLTKDYVPNDLQDGFISHATTVWGSKKYHDVWDREERLAYLLGLASLPRRLGIPICFCIVKRGIQGYPDDSLPPATYDHILAFNGAVTRADKYVRDYGREAEVATLVVENIPEMHKFLKLNLKNAREFPVKISDPRGLALPTWEEEISGEITQQFEFSISRIRDGIHFQAKDESPFLQIADAVAYAFRRFFSGQDLGDVFIEAAIGYAPIGKEWDAPESGGTFFWHQKKST